MISLKVFTVLSTEQYHVDRQIVSNLETVNHDHRLDPSRYSEMGEKFLRHLRQIGVPLKPVTDLDGFEEVFLPNRFTRIYVDDPSLGAPMLGTSTMFMTLLPLGSAIMNNSTRNFKKLWIIPGDILISRSGTVGTSVLCGESYAAHIASDDCFRLRLSKSWRGYVTAYLHSIFGQTLLARDAHGKVIKHLKSYDIYNLLIPIFPQVKISEINDSMLHAQALIDKARMKFKHADEILCTALNFDPGVAASDIWLNKKSATFLKSSIGLSRSRLDPHHSMPNVLHIRNELKGQPHVSLGEIADVWMPSRFARPKADPGYGESFYSSSDIMRARRLPSLTVSLRAKRHLEKCRVDRNTILLCRSGAFGGIMGRAAFVTDAMNGFVITEHMIRVQLKNTVYSPEYVYALLASPTFGYPLVTSYRHGKDVPELDPEELKAIPIPTLSDQQRKKISQTVQEALQHLDEANAHEEEAQTRLLELLKWEQHDADDVV